MFVDQVKIKVEGGTGGSGAEAFRRESGVPRGGPSGGDGGDGGSVWMEVDPQLSTLTDLRYRSEYRAERGQHGGGNHRTGRKGEDLVLKVPPGTQVRDVDSGEVLGELMKEGDRLAVARGGRGGRGNARFATATRQAPRHWEPGEEGERRSVELTLKLLADVGLVGEPNAGKSTLLATLSGARPKVADYPFTTLTPNLGVVELPDYRSFVMADIPGIIEGAHEGKGLGHRFLQHIERTRALAILIPVNDPEPQSTYEKLRRELGEYKEALLRRPCLLVFTKADLMPPDAELPGVEAPGIRGTFRVSAVARTGLRELSEALWGVLEEVGRSPLPGEESRPGDPDEEEWWERVDEELDDVP